MCGLIALVSPCEACPGPCDSIPQIHPGAIEIGMSGSATTVGGVTQADFGLRAGEFFSVRGALMAIALEPSYMHVEGLSLLDVEGSLSWEHRAGCSPAYGYVALEAGVRQEWIGSFREARYPLGFGLGLRLLASPTAGLRTEYRYRRVLRDPVADVTEHELVVGVSLFLHNR